MNRFKILNIASNNDIEIIIIITLQMLVLTDHLVSL